MEKKVFNRWLRLVKWRFDHAVNESIKGMREMDPPPSYLWEHVPVIVNWPSRQPHGGWIPTTCEQVAWRVPELKLRVTMTITMLMSQRSWQISCYQGSFPHKFS